MDLGFIVDFITNVGFPIGCVLLCMWYIKYKDDTARTDVNNARDTVNEMVKEYAKLSESINHNTESLNNQTIVLTQLVNKVGEKNE